MRWSKLQGEDMNSVERGGESSIVEAMAFWGQTTSISNLIWGSVLQVLF